VVAQRGAVIPYVGYRRGPVCPLWRFVGVALPAPAGARYGRQLVKWRLGLGMVAIGLPTQLRALGSTLAINFPMPTSAHIGSGGSRGNVGSPLRTCVARRESTQQSLAAGVGTEPAHPTPVSLLSLEAIQVAAS